MNARRLAVLCALGTAAICAGLTLGPLRAEEKALPRIGVVIPRIAWVEQSLRHELRARGYVDGESVAIDWRRYDSWDDTAGAMATGLVHSSPDVIVVYGTPFARAILDATKTIPVVFAVGDPLASGLVSSLSRPGANATGVSVVSVELTAKLLDLLMQLRPAPRRVVVIRNPSNPLGVRNVEELKSLATTLPVRLAIVDAKTGADINQALSPIRRRKADAVLIPSDLVFLADKETVVRAVRNTGLPAIFQDHAFTEAGGLMAYGPSPKEIDRSVAMHVEKILKGAKPADLPVEQVTRLTLSVNLKTAHELGITIPQTILLRADEVVR